MKARKGFTLVELLVVVLILGVLASIIVPRITESAADAKQAKCDANVANLIRAIEIRAAKNDGDYSADQTEFNSEILNSTTYFPHGVPTCPYGTTYTYNATTKSVAFHSH
ncbi:MAG: prepilin-type N-terminal cleavage/methylation domain-containing protein [Planctomycetes bacterium]|nr:prepilin-type N-terminal cleavage/methylation domain-containing protein [Planctomycetota bacterium]